MLIVIRCRLQKLPLEACLDCIQVYPLHDALEALAVLEAVVLQEQVWRWRWQWHQAPTQHVIQW